MFGFGKKSKDALTVENESLKATLKSRIADSSKKDDIINDLKKKTTSLSNELTLAEVENKALKNELADYKKKSEVKLKATKLSKGAKNEFAEFEAQAKSMSDTHKMYAALTVAKKVGGRAYIAEANTVGEMRDIIKQVRQGKLVVIGK